MILPCYLLAFCASVSSQRSRPLGKDTSVQILSELPLDKLLRIKNSLQETSPDYTNSSSPQYEIAGEAHAMALQSPPVRRTGYEEHDIKKTDSKVSSIFSLSVTALAFLAFGGYLLCLIVQAVKYKTEGAGAQPTFLVSAGIKRRPQVASYGRRRRDGGAGRRYAAAAAAPAPEELYGALLGLCEGYVEWERLNGSVL